MSGSKILLDTNVLIDYSKNLVNVSMLHSFDGFCLSIISYMEMYGYPFAILDEKLKIDSLFNISELIDINMSIADKVIDYRKKKRKKIKLPDAIILATASVYQIPLLTDDWDDFEGIDESVEIVKLEKFKH